MHHFLFNSSLEFPIVEYYCLVLQWKVLYTWFCFYFFFFFNCRPSKKKKSSGHKSMGTATCNTYGKFQRKIITPTWVEAPGSFSFLSKRPGFCKLMSLCANSFAVFFSELVYSNNYKLCTEIKKTSRICSIWNKKAFLPPRSYP